MMQYFCSGYNSCMGEVYPYREENTNLIGKYNSAMKFTMLTMLAMRCTLCKMYAVSDERIDNGNGKYMIHKVMVANVKLILKDNREIKINVTQEECHLRRIFKALCHANSVDEQLHILTEINAQKGYSTKATSTYIYNMKKDFSMVQEVECHYDNHRGCFLRGKRKNFILI